MAEEGPTEAPVCFFLGAGSSVPAKIPTTVGFVGEYRKHVESIPRLSTTFHELEKLLEVWTKSGPSPQDPVDVELLLESLALATNTRGNVAGAFINAEDSPILSDPVLPELLEDLRTFIRDRCSVDPARTTYWRSLLGLVQTYGRTHIFSTNYDLVLETFLQTAGYTYTDGFDQTWNPALFDSQGVQVCIYKLHGSVNWYRTLTGAYFKLPIRSPPRVVKTYSGADAEALMLYPAQKLEYSGPFLDMLGRLRDRLNSSVAAVVVGYSFRDPHIARVFAEALASNPNLVLIIIGPHAREIYETKLAGIRIDRLAVPPLDDVAESSSLRGRVFPIPTTVENANGFLYSHTIPKLFEALTKEYEVREKDLRFQAVDYGEVLRKHLEAGFLDRCEVIETRVDTLQSTFPGTFLDYPGRKWAVAAAFRDVEGADQLWRDFLDRVMELTGKYLWVGPAGGRNLFIRFVIGEHPGSGTVLEGSDVGRGWDACADFAEQFAAYAGEGPRQVWIMERERQLRRMCPYFETMSTANSNAAAWLSRRTQEIVVFDSSELRRVYGEAAERLPKTPDAQFVEELSPLVLRAERELVKTVVSHARALKLTKNPAHGERFRNSWLDRGIGPKVPKELR